MSPSLHHIDPFLSSLFPIFILSFLLFSSSWLYSLLPSLLPTFIPSSPIFFLSLLSPLLLFSSPLLFYSPLLSSILLSSLLFSSPLHSSLLFLFVLFSSFFFPFFLPIFYHLLFISFLLIFSHLSILFFSCTHQCRLCFHQEPSVTDTSFVQTDIPRTLRMAALYRHLNLSLHWLPVI